VSRRVFQMSSVHACKFLNSKLNNNYSSAGVLVKPTDTGVGYKKHLKVSNRKNEALKVYMQVNKLHTCT